MTTIFCAFRDSPQRREALAAPLGSAERYLLFGMDELRARGHTVRHDLEGERPPRWARFVGHASKRTLERAGGYGGDFATTLGTLQPANRADVVFSTVDTVGIPLMLLAHAGRLRPPLVYAAIGLPERLARLRSERMRRLYASALSDCASILAYSSREAEDLTSWIESHGGCASVGFVPFGVDTDALRPSGGDTPQEVVSVGADPHRDFDLLLDVARAMPSTAFVIVTTGDQARALVEPPPNVTVEIDLSFERMRERLAGARVIALPVRENTYSGATTVLLQSLALGKAVVVSRTGAIATGYGLVDGENCRLVAPGDATSFAQSVRDVLGDELHRRALGAAARRTAERELTWSRYVHRIEQALLSAAGSAARRRHP